MSSELTECVSVCVHVCVCAYVSHHQQQTVLQQVQNLKANTSGLILQETSGMWAFVCIQYVCIFCVRVCACVYVNNISYCQLWTIYMCACMFLCKDNTVSNLCFICF